MSYGSSGAGPSTPTASLTRRPQGARRRGLPSLVIANPDNSDDDGDSPPHTNAQRSPSGTGASPVSAASSSGKGSVPVPQPPSPSLSVKDRGNLPHPSVPAPQSSPLPAISTFPSPQPLIPTLLPGQSTYGPPDISPVPPQPPPQPQRHLQRAFTTPIPEPIPRPHPEHSSSAGVYPSNSPSRALPPLPSPRAASRQATLPSPQSHHPPHFQGCVSSPDDLISPATGSEGGGSIYSVGMAHRNRSGSVQGQQVRLQVTTDNEAFHLVDITGMNTAEGIREKVFSKLRIRDDDYPTLSMYRTEIGEAADETPILPAALLNLCSTLGDSRASLKFLVKQTDVPPSTAASVIPPVAPQNDYSYSRRSGVAPITTDLPNALLDRVTSRHSKEGSASSGELLDRGGLSASEWSDLGADADEWGMSKSGRKPSASGTGIRLSNSTGGSKSPITEHSASAGTSSPAIPTPPVVLHGIPLQNREPTILSSSPSSRPPSNHYDAISPIDHFKSTPTLIHSGPSNEDMYSGNAIPGPSNRSRPNQQGLGLSLDDDMDPETRALIEQLQREELDAQREEDERKRKDEELAIREQQSERELWEMMQQMQREKRQREQAQIADDEARARQVEAEQRREEEDRQAHEAVRAAWEAEQREHQENRFHTFEQDRRQRKKFFMDQARNGMSIEDTTRDATWTGAGASTDNLLNARRPSDGRAPLVSTPTPRPSQTPMPARQNSQPVYSIPPTPYPAENHYLPPRRPSAFTSSPYPEPPYAQDRLGDPRLQQSTGRTPAPGQRPQTATLPRPDSQRSRHPFSYVHHEQSNDHLQTPALQGARSMDNLRAMSGPQGMSSSRQNSGYSGPPPRTSITPVSAVYGERRNFQPAAAEPAYRSPTSERAGDSRYPGSVPIRPGTAFPLSTIDTGLVPFPSPHPSSASPNTASWRGSSHPFSSSVPRSARNATFENTSRPNTVHYDRSPPPPTSPETTIPPRRPSTLYDEVYSAEGTPTGDNGGPYHQRNATSHYPLDNRSRSGSFSAYRTASPSPTGEYRRSSQAAPENDESQLPYAHDMRSESSWLSVTKSGKGRSDTDASSVAGTVSSESTVRPSTEDNDSSDTAKAGQWDKHLRDMMARNMGDGDQTFMPRKDDEDEATLFLSAPPTQTSTPAPTLSRSGAVRPSPSKPNLIVDTASLDEPADQQNRADRNTGTPSDSATESEGTGDFGSSRVRRGKSFARPKDPNQWSFRPEPEQLYENLDTVFPQIDLDRPLVQGSESQPSTPGAESPSRVEMVGGMLLPVGAAPGRQGGPQAGTGSRQWQNQQGPPSASSIHPSPGGFNQTKFNKADKRRSLRYIARDKHLDLQRRISRHHPPPAYDFGEAEAPEIPAREYAGEAKTAEQQKKDNRRSSSMWDHKLVEVTRFAQVKGDTILESPADSQPGVVRWVKGELIGKGSYGRVYIALNATTGDMMAVKQVELPATEIDRHDQRQQGMVKALRDEIELLKGLEHTNIVAYLGYETSPEYLSIFLEYVPGGTIASIYRSLNQARFEPQLVRSFTEQILEGLAYLHSKNIWHRDLKGDNILVDGQGICKISDFGISKQTSDAYDSFGQATNMKGSVFWMAPEVVHAYSERSYSGKVDIWSLGCVVLEMWTGKRPWGEMEQIAAMFELFNKRRPPLPADCIIAPIALDFLNDKCLQTDPRDRPMARDLLEHPFIKDRDPNWTFEDSKIGKAVAKRGAKRMKA
ncbi:hypothetical protein IAR50_005546 [Cryptococcus sp. DSM 104548]